MVSGRLASTRRISRLLLCGIHIVDAPLIDALELSQSITQVQRIVDTTMSNKHYSAMLAFGRRHTYPSLEGKSAKFAGDGGVSILRELTEQCGVSS